MTAAPIDNLSDCTAPPKTGPVGSPQTTTAREDLLYVRNLKTHFPIRRGLFGRVIGHVKAVDGVGFSIPEGTTLGLVGESGCGKTTVGRTILRLIPATAGRVVFDGRNVFQARRAEMRRLRRDMQLIFQDPYGSLNPRMTVGNIIGEALTAHSLARGRRRRDRVVELLERVGLAAHHAGRYPHEFSGGQRQRIGIARALALQPRFIVCDEPVSALDVSIQSQIVNLLQDLQDQLGLTLLFIAHDLAVIEHLCDAVAVMYLGRIVEYAPARDLYAAPRHPYTQALLQAVPRPDPTRRHRPTLHGEVPSPADPPPGCHFHPRCPFAEDRCRSEDQTLLRIPGQTDHRVACWKADRL